MYPHLTDIACKNAKPQPKAYKKGDGGGLSLLVMPNGSRYWRLKYRFAGKEKILSLGVYPTVTLAEAREKCLKAHKLLTDGVDPIAAKRSKREEAERNAANTFEAVAREWHERHRSRWTPHYANDILHRLEMDVFPVFGRTPLVEMTPMIVLRALRKVEKRGALEMARRDGMYCNQVFRYAVITGRIAANPTTDLRGALMPARHRHFAALEPQDLPEFLHTLKENDARLFRQTKLALRLMLLTFVRTSELINARWEEFDLDGAQWTIPAERMKMRRPHIVPLARQAVAILRELEAINGHRQWVFASASKPRQPMSNGTILMALKRMGYKGRMTGHGFRALAMTAIQEKLKYPHDVVDRQLAHAPGDKLAAAYDRAQYLDERRTMMQEWADYLDRLSNGLPSNVIVGNFGRRS